MNWIGHGVGWLQTFVTAHMPAGDLQDLLVNGIIAGVGTTITFLPQILLLFFFIALLEDTGYMARAAFLMDKIMSKVGLHGKSFIPLLSSFACAIPGIMATRTIDDRKSRLVTILVAPLMSCSARIPVYTLMIAAFIPMRHVLGVFTLPGLTMMAMYFLGMVAAFCMAWLFKKHAAQRPAAGLLSGNAAVPQAVVALRPDDHAGARLSVPAPRRDGDSERQHRALVPEHLPEALAARACDAALRAGPGRATPADGLLELCAIRSGSSSSRTRSRAGRAARWSR